MTGPHVALRAPQEDGGVALLASQDDGGVALLASQDDRGGVVGVLIRAIVLVSASLGDGSHCTLIRTTVVSAGA